eukprot:30235-Amphidinium_carterae.1
MDTCFESTHGLSIPAATLAPNVTTRLSTRMWMPASTHAHGVEEELRAMKGATRLDRGTMPLSC